MLMHPIAIQPTPQAENPAAATNGQAGRNSPPPWRQWPKDKKFFRLYAEQLAIPRPTTPAEYDDQHLTALEFKLVVEIAHRDFRGDGVTIDRRDLARAIGLSGSDNDQDRVSKLLHGRWLPVYQLAEI